MDVSSVHDSNDGAEYQFSSWFQIYLINLRRRPDRRDRMLFSLNELEIDVKVVDAVDGK